MNYFLTFSFCFPPLYFNQIYHNITLHIFFLPQHFSVNFSSKNNELLYKRRERREKEELIKIDGGGKSGVAGTNAGIGVVGVEGDVGRIRERRIERRGIEERGKMIEGAVVQ